MKLWLQSLFKLDWQRRLHNSSRRHVI